MSMYSVLNTLSEYTYIYISKNISSYIFWLIFKIVESLQCILNAINSEILKMSENEIFRVLLFGNKSVTKDMNLWIITSSICFIKDSKGFDE